MGQRCSGARAQLDAVWDDARRREVEVAILGTQLVYAPDTWERVRRRLDDYGDQWVDKHTEVCRATSVRKEQTPETMELRMGCLHERRMSLGAVVSALTQADADVVKNAVTLATGLPSLRRCDDLVWLAEQDQRVSPPEDPQVAREVDELRERLAEIGAQNKAGKYADALTQVLPVVERAEALGYVPLLAEAVSWRGELRAANGQYTEAEQDLRDAYALAVEHGHDQVALAATQVLTYLVGYQLERHAEGLQWGHSGLPLAKRIGEPTDVAAVVSHQGIVLERQGKFEEAEARFREALELSESSLGVEHPEVAGYLNNLGGVLDRQGKFEDSVASLRRALGIRRKALGEVHPEVGSSLNNLGFVLSNQGKYEESESYLRSALELHETLLGRAHPDLAANLSALGLVLLRQDRYEESESCYRRALDLQENVHGDEHLNVAMLLRGLGNVLNRQGRHEEAAAHLHRALELTEEVLGTEHPSVARSLGDLGVLHSGQGQYAEAEAYYRRALPIFENALGVDHPDVALTLNNLGSVLFGQGKYEDSKIHYRKALDRYETMAGDTHPDIAHTLLGLAEVLLEMGDPRAARTHAERAVAVREANAVAPHKRAEARFMLARALWSDHAERARAWTLAQQAREAYVEDGPERAEVLAQIDRWLAEHRRPG